MAEPLGEDGTPHPQARGGTQGFVKQEWTEGTVRGTGPSRGATRGPFQTAPSRSEVFGGTVSLIQGGS